MTRSRTRAAMMLSLVAEAGDPRLVLWRERCDPLELWQSVVRGDAGIPDRWHDGAADAERQAEAALRRADAVGARWVVPGSPGWPVALDDLDQLEGIGQVTGAPLGLWVRGGGDLTSIASAPIAVVGARGCTTYGAESASDIAADCADQGHAVVSGAAFGIDACAHRGALLGGGPTVAVMACGVDVDYPRAHAALLRRIAEEGLVISEFAPGAQPQRHRFLVRNRIIAALSVGVVVVEAAGRSGSLNTLHWADQLGRTTMAVPGPITAQASCGTHRAIREGKALLVTSGRDVVADTFGLVDDGLPHVGPAARRVWVRLEAEPQPAEQIASALRLSPVAVHRALRELQGHGVVSVTERGWSRDITRPAEPGRVG